MNRQIRTMEVVYVETSVISLLVGNPSRDLILAGNQQTTRDWWRLRRAHFFCVASTEVMRESGEGDPQEAAKRRGILGQLTILPFSREADRRMKALLATRALPPSFGKCPNLETLGDRSTAPGMEIAKGLHTSRTNGRFT